MLQMYDHLRVAVDNALLMNLPPSDRVGIRMNSALRHALFPGGKRLRPLLSVLGARVFETSYADALPVSCAVEYVHTSSLIFDDLPCMDDAKIRRGVPALHRVYGEDVALLTGLALLNQSYLIFARTPGLLTEAASCIGLEGMIAGQLYDLRPRADEGSQTEILAKRNLKTSSLMRLALTAGALATGRSEKEVAALGKAGDCIGEAYQICDDLLDNEGSAEYGGKCNGQDRRHRRPTHDALEYEVSAERVRCLLNEVRACLIDAYGPGRTAELRSLLQISFTAMSPKKHESLIGRSVLASEVGFAS